MVTVLPRWARVPRVEDGVRSGSCRGELHCLSPLVFASYGAVKKRSLRYAGRRDVLWPAGPAVVSRLRPMAGVVRNLAASPAVSFGVVMAFGLAVDAVGAPVRWWSVLLRHCCRSRRRVALLPRRRGPYEAFGPGRSRSCCSAPWSSWACRLGARGRTPAPGAAQRRRDASRLFTARILRLGTLARIAWPSATCERDPSVGYYPFGFHLVAALVAACPAFRSALRSKPWWSRWRGPSCRSGVRPGRRVSRAPPSPCRRGGRRGRVPGSRTTPRIGAGLTMIAECPRTAGRGRALGVADDGHPLAVGAGLRRRRSPGLFEVHTPKSSGLAHGGRAASSYRWGSGAVERLRRVLAGVARRECGLPRGGTSTGADARGECKQPGVALHCGSARHAAWTDALTRSSARHGRTRRARGVGARRVLAAIRLRATGGSSRSHRRRVDLRRGPSLLMGRHADLRLVHARDRVVIDELFFVATFVGPRSGRGDRGAHRALQLAMRLTSRLTSREASREAVARGGPPRQVLPRVRSRIAACTVVVALVVGLSLVPLSRADRANLRLAFSGAATSTPGQREAFRYLARTSSRDSGCSTTSRRTRPGCTRTPVSRHCCRDGRARVSASDWGARVDLLHGAAQLATRPTLLVLPINGTCSGARLGAAVPVPHDDADPSRLERLAAWQLVFHSGTRNVFRRVA